MSNAFSNDFADRQSQAATATNWTTLNFLEMLRRKRVGSNEGDEDVDPADDTEVIQL